jgi:hypothetical protein
MPTPGRLSEDSSGGPPVLEGDGGVVGKRSIGTSGGEVASTSQLQLSAGNTPYPTIISLGSEYGGSERNDDHVQCGGCGSSMEYCHCEPLVLRPRGDEPLTDDIQLLTPLPNTTADKARRPIGGYIVYDLTMDGEETEVSTEAEEEVCRPVWVEVCVDGGVEAEGDDGTTIPAHRSGTDSSGASWRKKQHAVSPAPKGFNWNHGHHYIPFRIPTADGRRMMTAK